LSAEYFCLLTLCVQLPTVCPLDSALQSGQHPSPLKNVKSCFPHWGFKEVWEEKRER